LILQLDTDNRTLVVRSRSSCLIHILAVGLKLELARLDLVRVTPTTAVHTLRFRPRRSSGTAAPPLRRARSGPPNQHCAPVRSRLTGSGHAAAAADGHGAAQLRPHVPLPPSRSSRESMASPCAPRPPHSPAAPARRRRGRQRPKAAARLSLHGPPPSLSLGKSPGVPAP
jgi:hypothetical protein